MKKSVQELPNIPSDFDPEDYSLLFHDLSGNTKSAKLSSFSLSLSGEITFLDKTQDFQTNSTVSSGDNFDLDLSPYVPSHARVAFFNFYPHHDGSGRTALKIYSNQHYTDGYYVIVSDTDDKWKSREHRVGINVEIPIINQHVYFWIYSYDDYYEHYNNATSHLYAWM